MTGTIITNEAYELTKSAHPGDTGVSLAKAKSGIWICGVPFWVFGITDRAFAAFANGYLSAIELVQLFMAAFLFVSWLSLKPEESLRNTGVRTLQTYQAELDAEPNVAGLQAAQARMTELQDHHMISQEYVLSLPYACQIYHLLNLKHLETVHNFSLNNLKVIEVSDFKPTAIGGMITFQTILDSPFNVLRIWRQPIVEVQLILHTAYTVELSIPVYNGKRITVIFNALPLGESEHKLLIDIYSDLQWPKPLLQLILHMAACLTLFEDLPYLHKLAEKNMQRLANVGKASKHETMLLFKRFVDLYGSGLEGSAPIKAIEGAN